MTGVQTCALPICSAAASSRIHTEVENLTVKVDHTIKRRFPNGGVIHIEDIKDQVELSIMRAGYQDVARAYVIYREDRTKARNLVLSRLMTSQYQKTCS